MITSAPSWEQVEFSRLEGSFFRDCDVSTYTQPELQRLVDYSSSQLLSFSEDDPAPHAYFLASYLSSMPRVQRTLADYVVSDKADSRSQWLALSGAAKSRAPEVVELLRQLVHSPVANTQLCAIDAVNQLGSGARDFFDPLRV